MYRKITVIWKEERMSSMIQFFLSFFLSLTSSTYSLRLYRLIVAPDHSMTHTHTHTFSVGLFTTEDRSVADTST